MTEVVKLEEFERYKAKNPYNYSEMDLAKRSKALKDLEKDYPTVPSLWLEWLYDVIENKPKEEVEDMINNKLWLPIINKDRMNGGTLKSYEIVDA